MVDQYISNASWCVPLKVLLLLRLPLSLYRRRLLIFATHLFLYFIFNYSRHKIHHCHSPKLRVTPHFHVLWTLLRLFIICLDAISSCANIWNIHASMSSFFMLLVIEVILLRRIWVILKLSCFRTEFILLEKSWSIMTLCRICLSFSIISSRFTRASRYSFLHLPSFTFLKCVKIVKQ